MLLYGQSPLEIIFRLFYNTKLTQMQRRRKGGRRPARVSLFWGDTIL